MKNGVCNVDDGEFLGDGDRLGRFLAPSTCSGPGLVDGEQAGRSFNT